jgi:predicted AAA+ superfamily ATPase
MIKKYVKRENYLARIRPFVGKDLIKVLVGQRRVGKSYLLFQIMDELLRRGEARESFLYINKELYEFNQIRNYKDVLAYIGEQERRRKVKHIFIDEIQDIEHFEKALRHLQSKGSYDIYCTGSNAYLLSGELATYLSGRYVQFEILSLNYPEFLKFHRLENGKDALLKYFRYGGLPYLKNLSLEDETANEYLKSIYDTIILKDVVSRYKIRNVDFMRRLVEYVADNVGSLVSAKKISDFLKSQKIQTSPNVVLNYLDALVSAFLVFKVRRVEIQGKKIFEVNEKYYFEDLGLRNALVPYRPDDIGKILENAVYMHLRSLGFSVRIGKLGEKEVDFIAEKNRKTIYVQVAYVINGAETREREFGPLLAIRDNYPKYVVSMDEVNLGEYEGIRHVHVMDFLSRSADLEK